MKKLPIPCFGDSGELKQMLLRMKLSSCLLLLTFLHVSAHVRSQDKLTINVRSIGWQSFFDLLEKKSSYTFLYKDNIIPQQEKIDVTANELTVTQILDNAMRHSPLSYQLLPNHLIVITARSARGIEGQGMTRGIVGAGRPVAPMPSDTTALDIRVMGTVSSPTGEVLAGATVRVKGSQSGTSTDNT